MREFNVGDYAEVVSGMFDGCHGYVYEVDDIEKNIVLCGGVCVGFDRAWNLTRSPEKALRLSKNKKYKPNKVIVSTDAYIPMREQKILWAYRRLVRAIGWIFGVKNGTD